MYLCMRTLQLLTALGTTRLQDLHFLSLLGAQLGLFHPSLHACLQLGTGIHHDYCHTPELQQQGYRSVVLCCVFEFG